MRAADTYTFIYLYAAPLKRFNDILLCSGYKTLAVGVLYPEDKIAAIMTCKQVVIPPDGYRTPVDG